MCMFGKQNLPNMHTQNQEKAKAKTQEDSEHVREAKPPEHAHSKSGL